MSKELENLEVMNQENLETPEIETIPNETEQLQEST